MPYYKGVLDQLIDEGYPKAAQDVATRLLRLRTRLKNELPERNVSKSILMATWNIREFGRNEKCGKRLAESLLYIAEIVSHFDLVAIQEVNQNLADLQMLMKLLGNWWEYLVADVTLGKPGNQERTAFVYDGRKVRFDHLAGQLILPPAKRPVRQPARSPFICAFRAGWRRVTICSVHIYYGTSSPNNPRRVKEIGAVSELLGERNQKRQSLSDGEPENVVLLGDFNIFNKTGDKTSRALARNDFVIPTPLRKLPGSNLKGDKHFDPIAFHDPKNRLRSSRAGIFDFTKTIFGDNETKAYLQAMRRSVGSKLPKADDINEFYKNWRTFQISDHLPLWLELKTDFANAYLATVMRGSRGGKKPSLPPPMAATLGPKRRSSKNPRRPKRKSRTAARR